MSARRRTVLLVGALAVSACSEAAPSGSNGGEGAAQTAGGGGSAGTTETAGGGTGANGGEGGAGAKGGEGGTAGGTGGTGGCGDITYEGTCEGDTLIWCEDGVLKTADCAAMGKVCGYQDARVGYNCLSEGGFGYPVGDTASWPAGGWVVTQVLGHYLDWNGFKGGHLAEDIALSEAETANAPVFSVADGTVLYAGPNGSTYVNVVLIEHAVDGQKVCSFYGHLGSVTVTEGAVVARGDQIATVLDWNAAFGAANSHLHYVLLSAALCDASDAANGALICGYDNTAGPNGIEDLASEPAVYTSVGDACGDDAYPDAFIAPSQFIDAHHF